MFRYFIDSRLFKVLAVYISLNFIFQIISPTIALALTAGPSQPEMQGFSSVDVSNMVDLFTGDFKYDLPLLTVPGPGGGYPIKLNYNAGITAEQEASWVGLGWTLNPGSISREMKGIPDDFKEDQITKENALKTSHTFSLNVGVTLKNSEIFGQDVAKKNMDVGVSLNAGFSYNNFSGFRSTVSGGFSVPLAEVGESAFAGGMSVSYDSQQGISLAPSLSYEKEVVGSGGTREGLLRVGGSFSGSDANRGLYFGMGSLSHNTGFSPSSVPFNNVEMTGFSAALETKSGTVGATVTLDLFDTEVFYAYKAIKDPIKSYPAYGTMYLDQGSYGSGLMDFNREKDAPVNVHSKNLPIPQGTPDVFHLTTAENSMTFQTHRSDIGVFTDPTSNSRDDGVGLGLEFDAGFSELKTGVNPRYNKTESYSGPWTGDADVMSTRYPRYPEVVNNPYEPYYFKENFETSLSVIPNHVNYCDEPFRIALQHNKHNGKKYPKTIARATSICGAGSLGDAVIKGSREPRQSMIHAFTNEKLKDMENLFQ